MIVWFFIIVLHTSDVDIQVKVPNFATRDACVVAQQNVKVSSMQGYDVRACQSEPR